MLLCEYLFLFDYSVRQFERLAELVGLQTQTRERRDKERERKKEVNKEYLGNNNQTSLKVRSIYLSRHLKYCKKWIYLSFMFFFLLFYIKISNEISFRFAQELREDS